MITLFDHVFSPLRDNDLDSTLARFERAGFLVGPRKVRHSCGRLTGFALMTGSYLEFTSVVDEAEFEREAAWEDRIFRIQPQPYGIGARTNDARSVHRALKMIYPDIPPLLRRGEAASNDGKIHWSLCMTPRRAFPGATVFAIQYHGRRRTRREIRQGPNTIFALGGVVFCSDRSSERVAEWKKGLAKIAQVTAAGSKLKCGGQAIEWLSPENYRQRTGTDYLGAPEPLGGIAAVKLLCVNLREACRWLKAQDFTCTTRTKTTAFFAQDANTGYAFELIQQSPAKFLRFLADRPDATKRMREK